MKFKPIGRKGNNMEVYRGDIFYIEDRFTTQGHEQRPGRPAVVVSNNAGNCHSDNVSIVWLTTANKKPLPTHCEILCNVPSTALCEQVLTISQERLGTYIRSCTEEEMDAVDRCLMVALDLKAPAHDDSYDEAAIDMVDELKEKLKERHALLEAAENQIKEAHAYIVELQKERAALQDNSGGNMKADVIKLTTERDLYKNLYEQTLERMIAR